MGRFITFGRATPRESAFVDKFIAWCCIAVGVIIPIVGFGRQSADSYLNGVGCLFLIVVGAVRLRGLSGRAQSIVNWIAYGVWIALNISLVVGTTDVYYRWLLAVLLVLLIFALHRIDRPPVKSPGQSPDAQSE